ncbi:MAG: IPT/TIG domain-containing protein, partial [Bdellovibrionota bacterium]
MRNVCGIAQRSPNGSRALKLVVPLSLAITIGLGTASCSFSQRDSSRSLVRFEIAGRTSADSYARKMARVDGTPANVDEFDCYVVNVTGEGIAPTSYSTAGASCADLGVTSDLVPAATGGLIELEVPSGAGRTVQLIGVKSSAGCPAGTTLASLLLGPQAASFRGLYEIGRSTQDIFSDSTVELSNSYQAAAPIDALACAVPEAPILTSVTPSYGAVEGGTSIRIAGKAFRKDASASVGGTACATTTFGSSTELTCVSAKAVAEGTAEVKITHPGSGGSSEGVLASGFYFFAPYTLSPTAATVEVGAVQSLTVAGGVPPFSVTLLSGGGSVAAQIGSSRAFDFTAPTTAAGSSTLRITDARASTLDATISFVISRASQLALSAASTALRVGTCSGAMTATAQNSNQLTVAAAASISVTPSDSIGTIFYSDATCTQIATIFTIPAGSGSVVFYAKPTTASASSAIQVASTGLTSGSVTVTVAANASQLALSGSSEVASGACASVTLSLLNSSGSLVAATDAVSASLSASATTQSATLTGFGIYSSASCTASASTVSIPVGSSQILFYVSSLYAQGATLQASATGLTSASTGVSITAGPPASIQLTYVGSGSLSSLTVGSCIGAYSLQLRDSVGSAARTSSSLPVTIALSPALVQNTSSSGVFATTDCSGSPASSVTIAAGDSTKSFYLRSSDPGTLSFAASASAGALTSSALAATFQAGGLASLTLATGVSNSVAGNCSYAYTLRLRDSNGNAATLTSAATVTLGGSGAGTYYSDSSCTNSINTGIGFSINATPELAFYYKSNSAGYVTFAASTSAASAAYVSHHVRPSIPNQLIST